MSKGKYAARAAQGRAETASARADRLAQVLADERAAHAAEVASLKARVEELSCQLTGQVRELAADEVRRVQAEAAAAAQRQRQAWHDKALRVFDRIGAATSFSARPDAVYADGIAGKATISLIADLSEILEVPAGQALERWRAKEAGTSRAARRQDASRQRAAISGEKRTAIRGF